MNNQKKQQLRERIRTLGGLTADERSALLGLLAETKPYGLVWEEKPEEDVLDGDDKTQSTQTTLFDEEDMA